MSCSLTIPLDAGVGGGSTVTSSMLVSTATMRARVLTISSRRSPAPSTSWSAVSAAATWAPLVVVVMAGPSGVGKPTLTPGTDKQGRMLLRPLPATSLLVTSGLVDQFTYSSRALLFGLNYVSEHCRS